MGEQAYIILRKSGRFRDKTLFTENMINELSAELGAALPFRNSTGPDIYIHNHVDHWIHPFDMTRVVGRSGHVSKARIDVARLSRAVEGTSWTVRPVQEIPWVGIRTSEEFGEVVTIFVAPFAHGR